MATVSPDSVAQDQLQAFVRRIESLEDEIGALNGDKSEVYKEAKGNGFDTKVLRKVIADRRKDATERNEFDAVYQLYWDAVHGVVRAHVENIEEFPEHDADGVINSHSTAPALEQAPSVRDDGKPAPAPIGDGQRKGVRGAGGEPIIESEAALLPQTGVVETLVANSEDDKAAEPEQPVVTATSSAGTGADEDRQPIQDGGWEIIEGTHCEPPFAARNVPVESPADHSKPNPICRDPGDCGVYASWHLPCEACKRAALAVAA